MDFMSLTIIGLLVVLLILTALLLIRLRRPPTLPPALSDALSSVRSAIAQLPETVRAEGREARLDLRDTLTANAQTLETRLGGLDTGITTRLGVPDPMSPLALLLREPGSEVIIGGLWGVSYWRWLFVDQLFVPEAYRCRGLGTALWRQAEGGARERGCIGVWLLSLSFHAPQFYRRNGYEPFGSIEDYPPGHTCTYFVKRLS
jgi:GNAT superfamily N-acetyltransferase